MIAVNQEPGTVPVAYNKADRQEWNDLQNNPKIADTKRRYLSQSDPSTWTENKNPRRNSDGER